MPTRREFTLGLTSAAFGGLALAGCSHLAELPDMVKRVPGYGHRPMRRAFGYGPLARDEAGLFDLPEPFSYRIISCHGVPQVPGFAALDECVGRGGHRLEGGFPVPDSFDGMGSFRLDDRTTLLVRNHELEVGQGAQSPFPAGRPAHIRPFRPASGPIGPGGTTTIVYDHVGHRVLRQHLSLTGTIRNCAGGAAPWGAWLSCEEDFHDGHGFVFDVPALSAAEDEPRPLRHLGRFRHEAVALDPGSGIAYMTEDQIDSLFYRYVPPSGGDARDPGGELQALVFDPDDGADSRNWHRPHWPVETWRNVVWRSLGDTQPAADDLRKRGYRQQRAVRFANGEGIHFDPVTREIYFACTSGGPIKSGQIMRYVPDPDDVRRGRLQLFVEAADTRIINYADNLVVAPWGDLIVCEDPYFGGERNYIYRGIAEKLKVAPPCYLRGVTPAGEVYDVARLHGGSELAGVCFSADGKTLFVNVYSPGKTLAITGPWPRPRVEWSLYDAKAAGGA
ncbi:MAG: alkaline phosphatase PhoX [Allosphingosinicella sp.]